MPTGEIIYDLPEDQYHRETGLGDGKWLTRSMICDYLESPRGFFLRHIERVPHAQKKMTQSLRLGSVVDAILSGSSDSVILVPDEHLTPSGAMSTKKETRDWLDDMASKGVTVCDKETWALADLLTKEATRHPICGHLLQKTTAHQVTIRWTDPKTGLKLQTRPDRYAEGLCWGDDKTTKDPLHRFMNPVDTYGYDIQQVMAMDGSAAAGLTLPNGGPVPFCFLVMQTKYPFDVSVISLEQRVVESAYHRFHAALAGIYAGRFGSVDKQLRSAPVPFWWTAKHESSDGAGYNDPNEGESNDD